MMWVFAAIVVLALGGVALVAAGAGSRMGEEYGDQPDALVPAEGPLGADDLSRVRFSVTLRGYRMSEVDALIARLAEEARWREEGYAGWAEETPEDMPAGASSVSVDDTADAGPGAGPGRD